jgi:hypothetical protein
MFGVAGRSKPRSPEGFLARRATGEAVIGAVCRHVEPLVRDALDELGMPEDSLEVALFLWNAIYDPREILDLRRTLRWTRARIEQGLWRCSSARFTGTKAPAD